MKSVFSVLSFLFLLVGVVTCRVKNAPPELTALSPGQAYVGQEITLSGYQFGSDPVVTFGQSTTLVTARVVSISDESVRVVVPVIAPGQTSVRIQTREGSSDPLPFKVVQPQPSIDAVTPGNGLPGTNVVLTGNYLNQIKYIRFNDTEVDLQDSSVRQLTLKVPTISRGPAIILVETLGGQAQTSFIVAGTPQITSLSDRRIRPGAELTIKGVNLTDGLVSINGRVVDRNQTTVKDTEIKAIVPQSATSGRVTVSVFEKLVATSPDSLQIVLPPSVASLSARDGVAGDKIMLTGLNLRDVAGVFFGNTPVSFRALTNTQLEATVPSLPTPVQLSVSVTSVGGNATAADPFFYYTAPSAITVNPARQLRNLPITITGQNLYRITDVRVSGQSVPITDRIEGSQLIVSVPTTVLSGPVSVINRAGTATTARPLVVITKAVVNDIIPTKARPGERVVLRGDLLFNAQIFFTGAAGQAPDGGRNEDTERWVLVPADAQTGPIRVYNASGENTFTAPFTVVRLATITDFSPKTAKAGAELTITGQNLNTVTAVSFNGGTLAAKSFRLSGNSLIVTVPDGATTGQICLTNEAGNACTSANFTPSN